MSEQIVLSKNIEKETVVGLIDLFARNYNYLNAVEKKILTKLFLFFMENNIVSEDKYFDIFAEKFIYFRKQRSENEVEVDDE